MEGTLAVLGDDLDGDDYLLLQEPCDTCGARGPCAYDSAGRALIHLDVEIGLEG